MRELQAAQATHRDRPESGSMQLTLEKEVVLAGVTVQLATIRWEGMGQRPPHSGYSLFQRLSGDPSP